MDRSATRVAWARSRRARIAIAAFSVLAIVVTLLYPSTAQALNPGEFDGSTVYLINAETGRFLDADRSGAVRQSLLPKQDDQWVMSEISDGRFNLFNVEKKRYLDADGRRRHYDVNLSSNNRDADTQWDLVARDDGTWSLASVEYRGGWLDADGRRSHYNVNLTANGEDIDARWHIVQANVTQEQLRDSVVLIGNAATGRFLSTDGHTVADTVAPTTNDYWLIDVVDGQYTLRSVANDQLLRGANGDVDLKGQGNDDTRWTIQQGDGGRYSIANVGQGLALDGDRAYQGYGVDLTANIQDLDAMWNIFIVERDAGCTTGDLVSIDQALLCVSAEDMLTHLAALQSIADQNGGVRASGTPGFDQSADYVASALQAAGLVVERQVFDFRLYIENAASVSADGVSIVTQTMGFSGSGDVTSGNIVPINLDLGLGNNSTSGCDPQDFAAVDLSGPNDIALIQRGACDFGPKAANAQLAGAEAVIIFNQGDTSAPDRQGLIIGTLGDSNGFISIPVLDIGYDDGVALLTASVVDVAADTAVDTGTTENIIADLPGANPSNVVMAGAHLDSVLAGPGIQDNGTGATALLAVAETLAASENYVPQNTLRFAFWGAEEFGLIGSFEYVFNPVFGLSPPEVASISSYLNFDMIGSPNYVFGIYDADQSTFPAMGPLPPGSAEIEDIFEAYFSLSDLPYDGTEFNGRSDYQAFILAGIPAGGLFTGAEGIKTPPQVALWGGTAGEQYDACYHLACDVFDNVSYRAIDVNVDAIMYAIFNLAGSTESVNGVPGITVQGTTPDQVVLDGAKNSFVFGGGGFAPHYHNHDAPTS